MEATEGMEDKGDELQRMEGMEGREDSRDEVLERRGSEEGGVGVLRVRRERKEGGQKGWKTEGM